MIRVTQVRLNHSIINKMESNIYTDFECFTILRQTDVTGLQVQNRKGDCT
jgi:isopenicillin N synthase-like dioxygenase